MKDLAWMKFYVQDFMTDEKLSECSPHAHGILINLMCILHKQKDYGILMLKQKDKHVLKHVLKQNESMCSTVCLPFACKLTKNMPFMMEAILEGLEELLEEDVIQIEGDKLSQKRMIAEREMYLKKRKGGLATQKKKKSVEACAQASAQADASALSDSDSDSLSGIGEEEESEKKERSQIDHFIDEVITHLNDRTGRTFRLETKPSRNFIRARLRSFTVEDLCDVIDQQVKVWYGTSDAMYLRPETLFNETKFESYYQTVQDNKHGRIKEKSNGFRQDTSSRKQEDLNRLKQALHHQEGRSNEACSVDIS